MMHTELPITWATWYQPEWDTTPEAYLQAGTVKPNRSRRLGRYSDPLRGYKGYIGVYHLGDSRETEGKTRFFLSLFARGHTLGLKSFATIPEALAALEAFHMRAEAGNAD
jgi:hypothetical protein